MNILKGLLFIVGLMIGWSLGGCAAGDGTFRPRSTTTVHRIYESPHGHDVYRVDDGRGMSYASPIYTNPSGSTVWRID